LNKFSSLVLAIFLFSIFGFVVLSFILPAVDLAVESKTKESGSANISNFLETEKAVSEDSQIVVLATGDIMLDRGVEYYIKKNGGGDFSFPFLNISEYLKNADILFGNLESVISDKGTRVGSAYSFRADPRAMDALTYAGFDIVSVANNHALDYTRLALEDSLTRLNGVGIDYIGGGMFENEAFLLKTKEIKGAKIGFLAYCSVGPRVWRATKDSSGIALVEYADFEKIKKEVAAAKEKVDVLLISMHWGAEYAGEPDASQFFWGKRLIDAGADVIIGHHPHVIQPLEQYGGGWIAYSLGNFVFDQGFSEDTMRGMVLEIKIKDKKITEVASREVKISDNFQPTITKQ